MSGKPDQLAMVVRLLHAYKSYRPDVTGGVARVIEDILSCCQDFENRLLVARTKGRGRIHSEMGANVQAVSSLGELWSLPIAPTYPIEFARAVRDTDLVIQHAPFPLGDLGLLISRSKKAKLIVYWHADIVRKGLVARMVAALSAHTLKRADRIVVSHESIIRNSSILGSYEKKCVIVPFSVDLSYWSQLDEPQRIQSGRIRNRFPRLIVSVGRLVPYKGFDILVDAMRSVDGELVIIGAGPLRAQIEAQIEACGLQDRVFLKGHLSREEVKAILHASRVFAFPSVTAAEAFGLAQLEAMAVGLPVVNTNLPTAVPHVARHQREALTVQPAHVAELAAGLNKLLDDSQLAYRLGQAGKARAKSHFSPELFAERTRALFQDVLETKLDGETERQLLHPPAR